VAKETGSNPWERGRDDEDEEQEDVDDDDTSVASNESDSGKVWKAKRTLRKYVLMS
jgi:hypothetical protein